VSIVLAPRSVASSALALSALALSAVQRRRRCLAVVLVTVDVLELALLGLAEAQLARDAGRFVSYP
jgi:hypothetical protein